MGLLKGLVRETVYLSGLWRRAVTRTVILFSISLIYLL